MHVAYLGSAASVHTLRWANEMVTRGHTVDLVTMHQGGLVGTPRAPIRVHTLPWEGQAGYYLNAPACRRLMQKIGADLVHVHYASGYGTLARIAKLRPTLLSVWGSDVKVFPIQAAWKARVLRRNLAAADSVACTSSVLKAETLKYADGRPITVTPFGVDCGEFKPAQDLDNGGEFVIGTLKILEKTYGIDTLLKAFALLVRRYGTCRRLKLVIGGDGSERVALRDLCSALGLDDKVEFLGAVAHRDVPFLLNRLSAFVCLSRWESFGVVVLEASACGLPVVVSDVGGLTEVVQRDVTGLVVPPDDPQRTAEALATLIDNPDVGAEMGDAGRQFVSARYNWQDAVSHMEALYHRVVRG